MEAGLQGDSQREDLRQELAADLNGAFERLVLEYQDRLYRFALSYTGDPRDAEEVVQDALIRAYGALGRYEPTRVRELALRAWLYRITLNVARNRARGVRPRLVPLEGPDGDTALPEPEADSAERPDSVYEGAERRRELDALLAGLPARYREAVVLRHVEGLAYEEAAEVLGRKVGTVKSDVHRGLRLLRDAIGDRRTDEVI